MFHRQYRASIDIQAPKTVVWDVLTDTSNYELWNTFTEKVELNWQVGSPVKMHVRMNPDRKPIVQTEYLRQYEEGETISWGMNWWPLLKAERTQTLTFGENGCRYESVDIIKGPLTPLVHAIYGKPIQSGFERVCEGLKGYSEAKCGQ